MALKSSGPLGYVQQSLTTVANITDVASARAQASYVLLIPETNGIRWRDDGTDPTASIGMPIAAGASFVYDGDATKLRVVSQTGTSTLNVAYYESRHP